MMVHGVFIKIFKVTAKFVICLLCFSRMIMFFWEWVLGFYIIWNKYNGYITRVSCNWIGINRQRYDDYDESEY